MAPYLSEKQHIVELGAGAGLSKIILDIPHMILTDIKKYPWIDLEVDAHNLNFKPCSVDAFICCNIIHHLTYIAPFFKSLTQALSSGGVILIVEPENSLLHKMLMRITQHEGWNYDMNIFDENQMANDPDDFSLGNNAVGQLLWQSPKKFETEFPRLKVECNQLIECFIFILSGGLYTRVKTANLPTCLLKFFRAFDQQLIKFFPSIFPLFRKVVLRKT